MQGDPSRSKRNSSHRRKHNRSHLQRTEGDSSRINDKIEESIKQGPSSFILHDWSNMLNHLKEGPLQLLVLNDLSNLLSYASEDLLLGFDSLSFLQTLFQLLQQSDQHSGDKIPLTNQDPTFQMSCANCINMILDIFPESCKILDLNQKHFKHLALLLSNLEYIDLGEKIYSIIAKITKNSPKLLLKSNSIPNMLQNIDFFPTTTQIIALETISRSLAIVTSVSNYEEFIKPSLVPLSQFLLHPNDKIRESSLIAFNHLASNSIINDPDFTIPLSVFNNMKRLLDNEISIISKFNIYNVGTFDHKSDFKVSNCILDIVDISALFISSPNSSTLVDQSGLIESISKLFNIFVPENYSATSLFFVTRFLNFLNQLIPVISKPTGGLDKKNLGYFDKNIIVKILSSTKSSILKSFEHVNKWLNIEDPILSICHYTPVKIPLFYLNKRIRLEINYNNEATRLLSRPFVPFSRIISYITKNLNASLPLNVAFFDIQNQCPISITIFNEDFNASLLEVILKTTMARSIPSIWQRHHIIKVEALSEDKKTGDMHLTPRIKKLFSTDNLVLLKDDFNKIRAIINRLHTNKKNDEEFQKMLANNNLAGYDPNGLEMLITNKLADSSMLGVEQYIIDIILMKPDYFSLSLRQLLFYLEAQNLTRSIFYINNLIKSSIDSLTIISNKENNSSITSVMAAFELRLMKHYYHTVSSISHKPVPEIGCRYIDRVKINLDRNNILHGAAEAFSQIDFNTQPIVEFCLTNENGIGTGPTLEVYNLILESLGDVSKTIVPIFSTNSLNGLFPFPLDKDSVKLPDLSFFTFINKIEHEDLSNDYEKLIFHWWQFLGQLLACAMIDQRPLDIRLSPLFWRLVIDGDSSFSVFSPLGALSLVDYEMAKSLSNLRNLEHNELQEYLEEKGFIKLDDYYKHFVTSYFDKFLIPLAAFRRGFSLVMPIYMLGLFSPEELADWWHTGQLKFDINESKNYILADHGYTTDSKQFIWLLEVLSEFNDEEFRLFLKFCTGSPILPQGGFKNLKPLMTIVKKPIKSTDPLVLPSVMTCTNYLKLPDYKSKDVLKRMLLYAIYEGQNEFELS